MRPSERALWFEDVLEIRKKLIRGAVSTFRPYILPVDHMPHGAMGELLPALQHLRGHGANTRTVLGLRDILDAPEVVQRKWEHERAVAASFVV